VGEQNNFISVYPRGYGDYGGTDDEAYIAWNMGMLSEGIAKADETCFMDATPLCYDSCTDLCSRCSQNTCVDDIKFITELIDKLAQEYNIGDIFMSGSSNGAEFIHYFVSQRPEVARAVAPVFGLPLVGRINVPKELGKVPIMLSYDRHDEVIPHGGGVSNWNQIYEPMSTTMASWAREHYCKTATKLTGVNTPFDGGNFDMRCYEYRQCQDGRVMQCLYDGEHGTWPANIEHLQWWFFKQYLTTTQGD